MLRPLCAAIACVGLAAPSLRAAGVPSFADIPWGASKAQVIDHAAASGLRVVETHGNDIELAGEPFGAPATVHAMISPTIGLVRVQVRFDAGERPMEAYAAVLEALTGAYGVTDPVEMFKRPFVRGDGREDEALLKGKALLIAAWGDEREPGQASVILHAGAAGVSLDYQSHGWKGESARRQRQGSISPPAYAHADPLPSRTASGSVGP